MKQTRPVALKLPMKVQVTRTEIETGVAGNPLKCPVALALNRATGSQQPGDTWAIGLNDGEFYGHPVTRKVNFDDGVQDWIERFDIEAGVEPVEIEMDWDGGQLMLHLRDEEIQTTS